MWLATKDKKVSELRNRIGRRGNGLERCCKGMGGRG